MAEPFLTNECDPIDDSGHLTSCFIQNLDTGAIPAMDLYKISYEKIKPKLEKDLKWVFDLCRTAAHEAKFEVTFPYIDAIDTGEELSEYIAHWESRGATISTSVNLRATKTTVSLGMKGLTTNHISYLRGLGYEVKATTSGIRPEIHVISWNIK